MGRNGIVNKSGESIVLTEDGATRTPHIGRKPDGEERWNGRMLDKVKGITVGTSSRQVVPTDSC